MIEQVEAAEKMTVSVIVLYLAWFPVYSEDQTTV